VSARPRGGRDLDPDHQESCSAASRTQDLRGRDKFSNPLVPEQTGSHEDDGRSCRFGCRQKPGKIHSRTADEQRSSSGNAGPGPNVIAVAGVLEHDAAVLVAKADTQASNHQPSEHPGLRVAGRKDVSQARQGADDRRHARQTRCNRAVERGLKANVVNEYRPQSPVEPKQRNHRLELTEKLDALAAHVHDVGTNALARNLVQAGLARQSSVDLEPGFAQASGKRRSVLKEVAYLVVHKKDARRIPSRTRRTDESGAGLPDKTQGESHVASNRTGLDRARLSNPTAAFANPTVSLVGYQRAKPNRSCWRR